MKRSMIAGMLAAVMLLCGCSTQNSTPETTTPTEVTLPAPTETLAPEPVEEFPLPSPEELMEIRINGSTACLPLMAQVVSESTGMSLAEAESLVGAMGTASSWNYLIWGETDLLLVYEMPEQVQRSWELYHNDTDLEITPIGRDALVFLVNDQNPVQSLTRQQLVDIYTGAVTDWSEVGGNEAPIAAFQRNSTSGSQTLFRKLLMQGREPMEPTELMIMGSMSKLLTAVGEYRNLGNAIGYSVYYYVDQMKNEPGLRLLAVDDVAPNNDSIADNSYPLTNDFYVAIRADEPEDSPTRLLYNWICSDAGRDCLIHAGYIPVR